VFLIWNFFEAGIARIIHRGKGAALGGSRQFRREVDEHGP
jgi:hypothetical protein